MRLSRTGLLSKVGRGQSSGLGRPGRITVEALPPLPPGLDRKQFLAELQARIETATARPVAEGGAALP